MSVHNNNNWVRRFAVSEPRRHKKGFTVYKVTSIVFPKSSPEAASKIVVWKRYNNFKKLHHELETKHKQLYLRDSFPPFAKSKMFGRFDQEVIEERRKCALSLLEFIGEHSLLFTSNAFVQFFETGYSVDDNTVECPATSTGTDLHPPADAVETQRVTASISVEKTSPVANDNPTLDKPLLGGTWQFPRPPECISLSSDSSGFTDTDSSVVSGVSTPLQNTDLQFFDPLQHSPSKLPISSASNSWLLSMPHESSSPPGEVKSQKINNNQKRSQDLDSSGLRSSPSITKGNKRSVLGHTELPATSFLSVRTEDFEASNLSNVQHISNSDGISGVPTNGHLLSSSSLNHESHMESLSSINYIFEAAYHTSQAMLNEANGEFEAAFAFYKAGIACLLSGVQDETDIKRKAVVSEKINKYLVHAEKVYNQYLGTRSLAELSPQKSQLCRPPSELRCFRVLGVVDKLMLVLNVSEDCCYIVKVLHKSPCPVNHYQKTVMPQNVPFMVAMHCYFETETAVFLVLQHASGGKLWQHISLYFQSLPQTPIRMFKKENIYHGKTCRDVLENGSNVRAFNKEPSKVDVTKHVYSDLENDESDSASFSQEQSFLDVIREYTSGAKSHLTEANHSPPLTAVSIENLCDGELGRRANPPLVVNSNVCPERDSLDEANINASFSSTVGSLLPELTSQEDNNDSMTLINNNQTPDLLNPSSGNLGHSWQIMDTVPTHDLVKNAQRLLESVNETLMHSDIVVSRLERVTLPRDVYFSQPDDATSELVDDSAKERIGASVLAAVVDQSSQPSTKQNHASTKRPPFSKRCSIKSLERRVSSDDLFGGGSRALSGSLDREWGCGPARPRLPEGPIRCWAAQLLVCLDSLHRWGVTFRDLNPSNLLLGEKGQLLVTYMCQWEGVDLLPNPEVVRKLYAAPEVSGILPVTQAADWWSFGAILYELLIGRSLAISHPGGIHSHTIIDVPDHVSENAKSLLEELLRYNPLERLGSGVNGTEELKSHPFFSGVEWQTVLDEGSAS